MGHVIDDLYEEYRGKNVTFSAELQDYDYGMREFEIRDCNGHYLRFGCSLDELDSPGSD